ncbi:DExH-box ATP-dependent RNA helicase DExH18, mitochondrial [Raphanus sativus]|uniref:ATP-dependent RNA helicase SUV3L, mitochondrial n=1 Tax=Raphanus sativus TaxID=3726 RepID=A0A6J0NHM5_RAPSA|nr:DExH-box ATP-dependent RNA helicase DExH18, mitochondrial [Raphanus sativus]
MARGIARIFHRAYNTSRARLLSFTHTCRETHCRSLANPESHLLPTTRFSSDSPVRVHLPWNDYTLGFRKVRSFSSTVDNNGENDENKLEEEESLLGSGSESDGYDEEGVVVNELGDVDDSDSSLVSDAFSNNNNTAESSEAARALNAAFHDPVQLYKDLRGNKVRSNLQRNEWDTLHEIFAYFSQSGWAANQALAIYIGKSFFPTAVTKFRDFFFEKTCDLEVVRGLVRVGPTDDAVKFLFPVFVEFCIEEFPEEIKRFKSVVDSADLTKPATWFPFARAMKRKIVYHCGPTNSGKTYNALQRFMEAENGLYCSPLRLLAMEVFDKVNALGVYCSLLTGQEKKHVPFARHVSCTVEMVSTDECYEVAVIDEIQMMADPSRGHAWTKALLGLKADEIHLCGDPSVLEIVRKMCSETGDELVEEHYERFKPLVVEGKTLLGDLKNVKSGDCVVAFSRREIFEVKMAIEKHTKHRCCVIYGALPPETRRQQANLFNDQENEYDVLVASDAVGMGLNLNIRRVVFYSLSKYNGDKVVPVPASQVKQIAGRAGRRGSRYPDGLTTTLHLEDLTYLIECLQQPFDEVRKVGLFPFFEQIELFAAKVPDMAFSKLLEHFGKHCRLDGSYFLCRHDHVKKVANMLEKVQGLSLEDRFNFCFAPVNIRNPKAMYHLYRMASTYSQDMPVNVAMGMPKSSARNDTELLDLESRHQVLSMYLWLSNQFEEKNFPFVEKVEAMATNIAELLGESLTKANWKMESKEEVMKGQKKEEGGGYERPASLIKLKLVRNK